MPKADKTKTAPSKKEKQLHPNSRKAAKLTKTMHRDERLQKRKDEHDTKLSALGDKILWFKSQLTADKDKYSLSEVSDIIMKYINRFDDRLNEIKQQNEFNKEKGRHGRFHASEEAAIKMVVEREQDAFITGKFEAPDLTNRVNVKTIKKWDGEVKDVPNIKLRKFKDQSLKNIQQVNNLNEEGIEVDENKMDEKETKPNETPFL